MNRFYRYICAAVLMPVLLFSSCARRNEDGSTSVMMVARVTALGERIEVEVIESEYTSGPHWVLTHDGTVYKSAGGRTLSREDIAIGDTLEIYYNGQVMLSYPPQIVAHRIIKR